MSTDIDLEARCITASVGDLLGEKHKRSIGLAGSGLSRMWIGQELHQRVQEELATIEPGFQAEVAASASFEIDGWTLHLSGRADGVLFDGEQAVRVDEIKTLHFAVDLNNLYLQERLERFRRQLRLYALLLSDQDQPAAARLILVDIVSGDERSENVEWSPDAVLQWLRSTIHRLINAAQKRQARLEELRSLAGQIPFPHAVLRPAQQQIGDEVLASLDLGQHLLVRAPTGCGKTAAVLHPAVKNALAAGRRVFFLTAKTLQQKIAVEAVQAMQHGIFRSLQLRAKSKMCAHTEIICHEEICPYASEYGLKLVYSQLLENLLDGHEHQDPDVIFDEARNHELCPFEVSLDLLESTDVVICDYNYVFDPTIGLGALVHGEALNDAVLIIDEAHNLVERSRGYYSPTIDTRQIEAARDFLESRDNAVFRVLGGIVDDLEEYIRDNVGSVLGDSGTGSSHGSFGETELRDLRITLDGAMLEYFVYKREHELWMASDPVLDLFLALTRFHRVLGLGGDEFVQLVTRDDDGREEVKILCLDASRFLAETIDASAGVIAMSATLEPFEFYRDLLGFDPRLTRELFVPSPFPAQNRLVVSIEDVDTTYRKRAAYFDATAAWISRLAHPGKNVLVLFPSYVYMNAVLDRFHAPDHSVLVQQSGSRDDEQNSILGQLTEQGSQILFAVLGGIFAEGVDYPGAMLSQVIVVSPGLPPFNMERQLLKDYYQEHYGHGFSYAYLIPGLTRVVQAAGRLLRSSTDHGVITLIGRRFQDKRYARYLPEEWIGGDPKSMLCGDPEGMITTFFAAHDQPPDDSN